MRLLDCWWPYTLGTKLKLQIYVTPKKILHSVCAKSPNRNKKLNLLKYTNYFICMHVRTHACAHLKARHSARGLNVWKRIQQQVTMACQESAGRILPCLSEHAELEVSGSHSFTPPFLLPQWKDSTEWKERGERNLGGSRTRDEVCGATRERQTV